MPGTQYLNESLFKGKGKGKGKKAQSPAALAQKSQDDDRMAAEARANRERAEAEKEAREEAARAAARSKASDIAADVDAFDFVAETGFMQGRAEQQMDRHVLVKDLAKAASVMKLPIDHLNKPVALFAVYDGHLGPKCAEYCAQQFHKKLLPRLSASKASESATMEEQIRGCLRSALADLDQEFLAKFRTDRSGCSAQIGLLVGRTLFAAGLGGARAIIFCGSGGDKWATDVLHSEHRLSNPEELERVKASGGVVVGKQHFGPADYESRMRDFRVQKSSGMGCSQGPPTSSLFTRSLGDRDLKMPNAIVVPRPEIRAVLLQPEHRAFALCCDGVADVVSCAGMSEVLQYHAVDGKKANSELIQRAYNGGSEQNLTALTVFFKWPKKRTHSAAFARTEAYNAESEAAAALRRVRGSPSPTRKVEAYDAESEAAAALRRVRGSPSPTRKVEAYDAESEAAAALRRVRGTPELPKNWDCASCGETNASKREKCNGCDKMRPSEL